MQLIEQTAEVIEYARKHNLEDKLEFALNSLTQEFPEAQRVVVTVEPEWEKPEWHFILIDIHVPGPTREVLRRHRECSNRIGVDWDWPAVAQIRFDVEVVKTP
jgi:hypothetical protein